MILTLLTASQLLVVWFRFVSMGKDIAGRWLVFGFGALEFEMMGAPVILSLGFSIASIPVIMASAMAVAMLEEAGLVVTLLLVWWGHRACRAFLAASATGRLQRRSRSLQGSVPDGGQHLAHLCSGLNLGFAGFILMMLWLAGLGALIHVSDSLDVPIDEPADVTALLTSPLLIGAGMLTMLVVAVAHLVLVSIL